MELSTQEKIEICLKARKDKFFLGRKALELGITRQKLSMIMNNFNVSEDAPEHDKDHILEIKKYYKNETSTCTVGRLMGLNQFYIAQIYRAFDKSGGKNTVVKVQIEIPKPIHLVDNSVCNMITTNEIIGSRL